MKYNKSKKRYNKIKDFLLRKDFNGFTKDDLFIMSFIKKGWINRNNILINGNKYLFTVPLKNISQNFLINEIQI